MSKPVTSPDYWRRRIVEAFARGWDLHKAVYDIDASIWNKIQAQTRSCLLPKVHRGTKILDVGCGYGALLDCLHDQEDVGYCGIDISPDLLEIARIRHPDRTFAELDATVPLPFHPGEFDLAVFRSVQDMVVDNVDSIYWSRMMDQVKRVSREVAVIEYEQLPIYCRFEKGYR